MQLLLEKSLLNFASPDAVQRPESAVPIGTSPDDLSFAHHLQTVPATGFPPAAAEQVVMVNGTPLPLDGNLLPPTTDKPPPEGLARGRGTGELLRHTDGPVAAKRDRVAELQLDTGQVARSFDATRTPPGGLAHSSSIVSSALDKDRKPGSVSERATTLPAAELAQKIQAQRGFNTGAPAQIGRDVRFGRNADTGPVTDRESAVPEGFTRSTAAGSQNHRAELASQIVQELNALKVSTDTPGARMSSTFVAPPTQPVLGAVPAGGVNQSAAIPAPVVTVNTPVFDPGWADALQDRVMWLVGRNVQAAEVRLNPPELGPVQVQISVDDNVAKIAFNATHAATREALEMALPRLKEMFAENGMALDGASVSDQGVEDRREESDSLWQSDSAPDGDESKQAVSAPLLNDRAVDEPAGLVDTYA